MLAIRSEYFNSMFSSNLLEATQNTIMLETSYVVFIKTLEFLYCDTLTLESVTAENIIEIIELVKFNNDYILLIIIQSVKWLIKNLNNFCDKLLCSEYSIDNDNVLDLLQFSQLYNVNNLYKKCLNLNNKKI